jgi:hypothetical protein
MFKKKQPSDEWESAFPVENTPGVQSLHRYLDIDWNIPQ